ncbi:lipoprotein [Amycolatopsis jiangsuensis]|uniref:Lipoprotein n=1 Tax=Amycolatopsis jiangsuensis TaxID=1181879 RepID=A0A840IZU3_9PSEU|nr:hypothetical protein [Amycolatopsis jiangsuensis]MBB4688381.1 hypothetical protein [Amycolatopsis jiangsuensis]
MKRWFAGALLVAALAGCSPEPPSAPPVTLPAPSSSFHSMFSSTPATPSTSSPATTAGPALTSQPMTAADGRKTSACRDGSCEILVTAGTSVPFTTYNGSGSAMVDSVGPEGIVLTVSAGISGQFTSGPSAGQFAELNDVKFVLAAARAGRGVLRLTRG